MGCPEKDESANAHENSVLVRLATLPGTVDEAVSQTLCHKMKSINELLG